MATVHRTCSVEDCGRPLRAKGFCASHWRQNHRGQQLKPIRAHLVPARVRFNDLYEADANGCWIWTGAIAKTGYGTISARGEVWLAHRLSYTIHRGGIPSDLLIDHTCRVPACVNPNHLQLATKQTNGENLGMSARNRSGVRGVCWDKRTRSWMAYVTSAGRRVHVGRYKLLGDAERAAIAKRNELMTNNLLDRT